MTPLGKWDTSSVEDMHAIFAHCFDGCTSLTEIDMAPLGGWNTVPVDDIFRGCAALMDVDVPQSGWADDRGWDDEER